MSLAGSKWALKKFQLLLEEAKLHLEKIIINNTQ